MAKVSLIVPVYNVAPYIEATIRSLLDQTLRDIEVLAYDDNSTDGSSQILDRLASEDPRLHVVHYTENKTAAQARKDGALASTGEYVIYVDGDDTLAPNACEELSALMDADNVDMLQFNTTILSEEPLPQQRLDNMVRLLMPYNGRLEGNIIDRCFVEKKFHFQIWNKIFRGDIVRKAMALFPDGRFSKAQDLFAFYLIAFFSHSYLGLPDRYYYIYGFGRGVTGHAVIGRPTIVRYADQALVANGVRDFLLSQNAYEDYANSHAIIEKQLLNDSVAQLINHVSPEDSAFAFDRMCDKWTAPMVITQLIEKQYRNTERWAEELASAESLKAVPRKTRHIGTFYHRITNGGAQRVVAALVNLWTEMGYEVTLFTDEEPSDTDYPIPASTRRVVLPAFDPSDREVYAKRMQILHDSVKELNIDLFITHAWVAPSLLWDMLSVKTAGALFYVHCHSVFTAPLMSRSIYRQFFNMPEVYSLADGVMALSRTDAHYWSSFCRRTFTIVNPLTFDPVSEPTSPLDGERILWVGRLSAEKAPLQLLDIMKQVREKHPNALLCIVGSGSEEMEQQMRDRIAEDELENNVELCGFQSDVKPFYLTSDIYLSTSDYEGFPVSMTEAESLGLPVVTYTLPYLSLLETGRGSIQVPMGDSSAAAKAVSSLLGDREGLKRLGAEARENVLTVCNIDFKALWNDIISSTEVESAPVDTASVNRVMLDTIRNYAVCLTGVSLSSAGGSDGSQWLAQHRLGRINDISSELSAAKQELNGAQWLLNHREKHIAELTELVNKYKKELGGATWLADHRLELINDLKAENAALKKKVPKANIVRRAARKAKRILKKLISR